MVLFIIHYTNKGNNSLFSRTPTYWGNDTVSWYGDVNNPYGEVILMVIRLISPYGETVLSCTDMTLPFFEIVSLYADIISPCAEAIQMDGSCIQSCDDVAFRLVLEVVIIEYLLLSNNEIV
ncbi:hypothetical protein H8B06_01960 [Sphingobacterium sp. DN00404]|uniref:Uncharacterized protein n=1 Tax=Sphingobacterium micropteri TaxID=2763501 RepID=A0ABR7YJS8_9SPHI|nr:hypothetical protein [Sphingobacterium micropteri]MBD1431575.1 hypothetical protein [Sphingobacterium micropteri]